MKWLLVFAVYQAPPGAVDWDGPWTMGITHLIEGSFDSEAACRNEAIQIKGRLHQGMLAPVRYRCVPMPADLPKGAER